MHGASQSKKEASLMLLQTAFIRENGVLLSKVQYAPGFNKQLLTISSLFIYLSYLFVTPRLGAQNCRI